MAGPAKTVENVWGPVLASLRENVTRLESREIVGRQVGYEEKVAFFERVGWQLTVAQEAIARSERRYKRIKMGRRGGKTTHVIREAVAQLCLRPGAQVGLGTRYEAALQRDWAMMMGDLAHVASLGHCKILRRADATREVLLGNFSALQGGILKDPDSWRGAGLDLFIGDEAALFEPWAWRIVIEPSLADRRGSAFLISTPQLRNWFDQIAEEEVRRLKREARLEGIVEPEAIERFVDRQLIWDAFQYPSWSNSFVFPLGKDDPEIIRLRRTMPAADFLREICAVSVPDTRLVYPEFDEEVHVGAFNFRPNVPVHLAVDPSGGVNPYAVVAIQDHGEVLVIFDEFYQSGVLTEQVVSELSRRPWWKQVEVAVFDDAVPQEAVRWRTLAGESFDCLTAGKMQTGSAARTTIVKRWLRDPLRYESTATTIREDVTKHYMTERAIEELQPGDVNEVELLVAQEMGTEKLRDCARLFVDASATCTIHEFLHYRNRAPRHEGWNAPERPIDANDHSMQALEYYMWKMKRRY